MGYPNAYDRDHGRTGSYLMIHGACISTGCYALTDENIEEVYTLVEAALNAGQESVPIHAFPFRMTAETLEKHKNSQWYNFWISELLPAYQNFDQNRIPQRYMTCAGNYHALSDEEQIPETCTKIAAWE
jgi:murein L,D-transpeptidase YafK